MPEFLLAPREYQAAELLSKALSQAQIAREMGITWGTLKVYLSRIYAKTGFRHCGSPAVALAVAFIQGRVGLAPPVDHGRPFRRTVRRAEDPKPEANQALPPPQLRGNQPPESAAAAPPAKPRPVNQNDEAWDERFKQLEDPEYYRRGAFPRIGSTLS